jgi:hypothetical protein
MLRKIITILKLNFMKTKFFFFAMLVNVAASAQTLNIKIATINYTTKIATCDLSWTGRNATLLSDVWVFVDYIEISGSTTTGSWKPATITGATVTQKNIGNATASTVSGNTRGVWIKSVTSGANFTGQITLQLSGIPAKFNACAYATDYPPNIATLVNGTYTLKGTKPFIINGVSVDNKTYPAGSITSITDATKCPGCIDIRDHAVSTNVPCCPRLTAIGGYCRDLIADEAKAAILCNLEVKNEAINIYPSASCPAGWRWNTAEEFLCLRDNQYIWLGQGHYGVSDYVSACGGSIMAWNNHSNAMRWECFSSSQIRWVYCVR